MAHAHHRVRRLVVITIRWGLPLILLIGGIVCIVLGHGQINHINGSTVGVDSGSSVMTQIPTGRDSMFSAIGVGSLIVALMVVLLGWLMRLTASDGLDRLREEAARDYFARTGRWPGERGPGQSADE